MVCEWTDFCVTQMCMCINRGIHYSNQLVMIFLIRNTHDSGIPLLIYIPIPVCRILKPQAPNALNLLSEQPDGVDAKRYKTTRGYQSLYKAAAQLWKEGVEMNRAIKIVSEALDVVAGKKS